MSKKLEKSQKLDRCLATFLDKVISRYHSDDLKDYREVALLNDFCVSEDDPNFESKRKKIGRMKKGIMEFFNKAFSDYNQ